MFLIDINKKMLTENPVPSNLQVVPVLDDFVKALLVSQMVITTDHQMEKFLEKLLQVRGLLSWLWRKLEDIRNESSEAVEVPADTFATLTEQTTLLLGQASLSISYTHCLNILKTLWKDPCKAKALLKEKQPHCQKMKVTYLAKNPFTHNWNWMLKEKYSLLKSPLPSQNRPKGGGWYYYTAESSNWVQNKNVQFQNNASTSTSKFHCAGSASNGKYVFYNSKGSTCHQQFRTGSTNKDYNSSACASNNKKIIYKKPGGLA